MYSNQRVAPISAGYGQFGDPRQQMLMQLLQKYQISPEFSTRLQQSLVQTKTVFVFDDSGSMNATLNSSPLNTAGGQQARRWDELKAFAQIAVEVANVFNPEGSDVFFLNRPAARNVRTFTDLQPYFQTPPKGVTPISRTLVDVLRENSQQRLGGQKLLVVIVTDGEPTNESGQIDIPTFKSILESREQHVFTSIVACTDEQGTMSYLNDWDRIIPRLDVVDDYRSELSEIQQVRGYGFNFSHGDYVVKSLIGSMDSQLDYYDEQQQQTGGQFGGNLNSVNNWMSANYQSNIQQQEKVAAAHLTNSQYQGVYSGTQRGGAMTGGQGNRRSKRVKSTGCRCSLM